MSFRNLKIKTLIICIIGLLVSLLILTGLGGMFNTRQAVNALETITLQDLNAQAALDKIRLRMETNRSQVLQALQHNPATQYAAMHDHPATVHFGLIRSNSEEITKLWKNYEQEIKAGEEKDLAQQWYETSGELGTVSAKAAARAIETADWDGAQNILIKTINPSYRKADAIVAKLSSVLQQRTQDDHAAVNAGIARATNLMIGVLAAGVLLSLVAGIYMLRAIGRPLNASVEAAHRVAQGDLTGDIDATSTNEFGLLLSALKSMNGNLVSIVTEVRSGTDDIATASSEIAGGNADLSARTEQQASALEETASSMEELTATVRQNSDSARQANTLAISASEVAVQGGRVVAQVVETMSAINQSSRQVMDIIGVIDGIAFQTNILALNAAVEAARAGEQGRGFAVVASEVRTLAQRSAAAAKEIKALIGASVEQVELGSKLVDSAGTTMGDIVASVKRVTDIMGDISAAGKEQEAGIEQINRAIGEMDAVTQQNAALVEQAASASAMLQEKAASLAENVRFFTLDAEPAPQHSQAPARRPAKPRAAIGYATA